MWLITKRCLTTEVIMEFAFARSANMLEEEESTFDSWFLRAFDSVASDIWTAHEWPVLRRIGSCLPKSIVKIMNKKVASFFEVINVRRAMPLQLFVLGITV
ncbi:unnamed protein product [Aspergillus oryzae var. brunneus]|uniref:Unnamed protein product n=2 Tax=Aspergillus oryzae TaxID=5062 RepID=A0AAN4Y866_ASPOZ|nr:unnamed protein product [Aspergillus oryzae]GMG44804.1 unnamed protein product [Aspergillus oryzae var. brunneus]